MLRRRLNKKPLRPPFAPAGGILVYVGAGQSNMAGVGATTAPRVYRASTEVYYKSDEASTADDGAYSQYEFNVNTTSENLSGGTQNRPNPSIYFVAALEDLCPNPIKIFQVAIGTTGFTNGTGAWADGGSLKEGLINAYLKPGLQKLASANPGTPIYLMPFFLMLGEEDSRLSSSADVYAEQCSDLFADLRSALNLPTWPCVAGRLNSAIDQVSRPQYKTIQQQQSILAADSKHNYLLNLDDIPLIADNVHYSATGYEIIGIQKYLTAARDIGVTLWQDDGFVEISSAPLASNIVATSLEVAATTAEYTTLYSAVYADGTTEPSAADLKAGVGAVAFDSVSLIYNTSSSVSLSGLTAETNYELYSLLEDLAGNQSQIFTEAVLTPSSQFGAITEAYESAVVAASGTLSAEAKDLVQDFLYSSYSDGSSGTGAVADFSSKFAYLWLPVSTFAGVIVPVIGNNFTNVGFISSDYVITAGLRGDNSSILRTGYILASASQDDNSQGTWVFSNWGSSEGLMGARASGSHGQIIFSSSDGQRRFRNCQDGDTEILDGATTTGFFHQNRTSSSSVNVWRNLTETVVSESSTGRPQVESYLFAWNTSGSATLPTDARLHAAWETTTALTTAETNILYNALNAATSARAGLT